MMEDCDGYVHMDYEIVTVTYSRRIMKILTRKPTRFPDFQDFFCIFFI